MGTKPHIIAYEELKKLRKPIQNVNVKHKETLGALEKVALWITNYVGSMGFFLIIFGWTVLWLGWNTMGPTELRFDPFPAFVLMAICIKCTSDFPYAFNYDWAKSTR